MPDTSDQRFVGVAAESSAATASGRDGSDAMSSHEATLTDDGNGGVSESPGKVECTFKAVVN